MTKDEAISRCAPPPEHLDKRWHRLRNINDGAITGGAFYYVDKDHSGWWLGGSVVLPSEVWSKGFRYVGPAHQTHARVMLQR